jgi:hypothetical protein
MDFTDPVGSEHADMESVRAEAVDNISERLRGTLLVGKDVSAWLMNVTDETGLTVMIVSFAAAVQIVNPALAAARLLNYGD